MRCVDSCSVPSCGPVTILDDHLGVSNSNFGHHFPHFRIYGLDVRLSGLIVWSLYVDIGCNFFKITLHVMYTPNLAIHLVPTTDTKVVRKYNINMPFRKQTEMPLSTIVKPYNLKLSTRINFNGQFSVFNRTVT